MDPRPPAPAPGSRRVWTLSSLVLAAAIAAPTVPAADLATWRQGSASDFARARKEGVVISDAGRVRLGRGVEPVGSLEADRVWALARSGESVFAATGDAGKVYRRDGHGAWSVAFDAPDTQALALAPLPDGRVFAGTGPSGSVVEVTDPSHPSSRPDPSVQYIWSLAGAPDGSLYAATGPEGGLWKRSPEGAWSLLLDSKHPHLLAVAVGPDGSVYAGSDGAGLVYRVAPGGRVSVLYDAPQDEVRALLVAPDGVLYAGTAQDPGGGPSGGPSRGLSLPNLGGAERRGGPERASVAAPAGAGSGASADPPAAPGGTASPRPSTPGENAVYRIDPDGAVREVFRARTLVFALARQEDRLLVGTGPEGLLHEVRDSGRETVPLARLDHGQVLALLPASDGSVLIGAGDPGGVLRLGSGHVAGGTLTSDVLDAKLVSRFGLLSRDADTPRGTTVALRVRSGNVGEPDETWSDWTEPLADPASPLANVPPGRFLQYRAQLATDDPSVSPELRSVTLRYRTINLPPELSRIEVPDLSRGDGATRQTKLTLKWEATDPNGDDLSYTLHLRKEGWPDWVRLGADPLTEKTHAWDTTALPAGVYRLRVTASDRPSNPPGSAFERALTSDPFLVDHQAPDVAVDLLSGRRARVSLEDGLTRLVNASYALDGGEWVPIFPDDGLFDTPRETIALDLPDLPPGPHVLMVRATDAAGNLGSGDAVFTEPIP